MPLRRDAALLEDQPLLDRAAGAAGMAWRPSLGSPPRSETSLEPVAFHADLTEDDCWRCAACRSWSYAWCDQRQSWRCMDCGSMTFSLQSQPVHLGHRAGTLEPDPTGQVRAEPNTTYHTDLPEYPTHMFQDYLMYMFLEFPKYQLAHLPVVLTDHKGTPGGSTSSPSTWNTLKGPTHGVRYRGGQPPQPPGWHYDKNDLAAFRKWKKRIEMWALQVVNYVPKREAGILLFNSLKGELEEELEDAPLEKIFDVDGVTFIMDTIQKAVETRSVHLKRQLLNTYEHIYRAPQETMRSFVNRYARTERALGTVGIKVTDMYDAEARGARMLERAKLSQEHQRQILIGTGQSLEFDNIKDVMLFQWPEHKPLPPPLHQPGGKGFRGGAPPPAGGKGKSKGKGTPPPRQTFVTEANETDLTMEEPDMDPDPEEPPAEEDADNEVTSQADQEELEWDEDDPEVAQILTVTARKLAGVLQARKYGSSSTSTSMPKRSISDRKKMTHCSACGAQGHWAGDAECAVSAKGKSSGKGTKRRQGPWQDRQGRQD
ncbi:unnamed protein product [Durusdinium trenchii]|uniref:Uncharacterized protein n=1 Tax=Durusdinium trenchii TaxID=1381693 RepID=A0ABP0JK46_9DINO